MPRFQHGCNAEHPHDRLVDASTGTLHISEQQCLSASPGHRPIACFLAGLRALEQTEAGCTALSMPVPQCKPDHHPVACCTADLKAEELAMAQAARHHTGLHHSISLAVTRWNALQSWGGGSQLPAQQDLAAQCRFTSQSASHRGAGGRRRPRQAAKQEVTPSASLPPAETIFGCGPPEDMQENS